MPVLPPAARALAELPIALGAGALRGALSVLPEPVARGAGAGLGRLARSPLGVRRRVVERQLAAAFPERGEAWVRVVSAACYRHFGEELALTARLAGRGDDLLARVEDAAAAREILAAAGPPDRGAIVVTGHLGNWELAGSFLAALRFPVTAVARRQEGLLGRRLAALRSRLGIESVSMEDAPRRLPAALREGRIVALVADQHAAARGLPVPFLGRPASTFRGPARLSLACGVPLLFGALVREGEGYRPLLEPVREPGARRGRVGGGPSGDQGEGSADDHGASPAGDLPEGTGDHVGEGPGAARELGPEDRLETGPEGELTRRWVAHLEAAIRERPEQYFWFHRRWKPVRGVRNAAGGRR